MELPPVVPTTPLQDGYKKKFVLTLFKQKFGSDARDALEGCMEQWHEAMPDLLAKAHIDPEDVTSKLKGSMKNPGALKMWVRHFLGRFMLTHLASIRSADCFAFGC